MKPAVVIVVNGILTPPGNRYAFTDQMQAMLVEDHGLEAVAFEYWSGVLTRRLAQHWRILDLAAVINSVPGRRIVLVGHSNGAVVILGALKLTRRPIETVWLVAAACDADFDRNGLNERLERGQIKRVRVMSGAKDWPLRIAWLTRVFLLRWIGLGYGSLGYEGPRNCRFPQATRVRVHPDFGHGGWIRGEGLKQLCSEVVRDIKPTTK